MTSLYFNLTLDQKDIDEIENEPKIDIDTIYYQRRNIYKFRYL